MSQQDIQPSIEQLPASPSRCKPIQIHYSLSPPHCKFWPARQRNMLRAADFSLSQSFHSVLPLTDAKFRGFPFTGFQLARRYRIPRLEVPNLSDPAVGDASGAKFERQNLLWEHVWASKTELQHIAQSWFKVSP